MDCIPQLAGEKTAEMKWPQKPKGKKEKRAGGVQRFEQRAEAMQVERRNSDCVQRSAVRA